MFNKKIDEFSNYNNQISNLMANKLECLEKIDTINNQISDLDKQINNLKKERLDYGLHYYLDKEKRQYLLQQARKYGFSESKINSLSPFIDNWNQDIITNETLDMLNLIENFIKNNEESYKNNVMYKLSKLFHGEGNIINENQHYDT